MRSPAIPFHTFIVRYRLEASDAGQPAHRRAMVIHLPGDESMEFREDGDLTAFIHRMLDQSAGDPTS